MPPKKATTYGSIKRDGVHRLQQLLFHLIGQRMAFPGRLNSSDVALLVSALEIISQRVEKENAWYRPS